MEETEASVFLVATSVGLATGSIGAGYIIRRFVVFLPFVPSLLTLYV